MIEVFCPEPTIKRVARLASGWELSADMVRIRRPLKILQVARGASGGKALELADGRALVAFIALHRGVSTQ
jgi:hypothetical protein